MTTLALPIPERIRKRHRRRPDLTVAQWSERFRCVTDGPLLGGAESIRWSNDTFPPGMDIMESCIGGRFRRTVLMAAPQTSGKTALAINVLLYALHWLRRDVMYIHATAADGEKQYAKKIGPSIEAEPELAGLIPPSRDDIGTKEHHRFVNGCSFHVTGSESEADLSGVTVPAIFFDDVHAMAPTLGAHGHAIEFAEKRSAAYPPAERVSICAGQAGDVSNWLWRALQNSAWYVLYLPCLGCGTYQLLDWERMQFNAATPETASEDCWLRCARTECKHEIRHDELPEMLRRYAWVSTPAGTDPVRDPGERTRLDDLEGETLYPETERPVQDAGFWWPAFTWPLVPWTTYAKDYVSATGNPDSLKTLNQQVRVIPYEEPKLDEDALEKEDILRHITEGHRWKTIPAAAGVQDGEGVVIVTADVQAGYIWYLAVAWHKATGTGWLIEAGRYGGKVSTKEFPTTKERKVVWKSRVATALEKLWGKDDEGWPIVADDGEVVGQASGALVLIDCSFIRETVLTACRLRNGGRWGGKWRGVEGSQSKARTNTPVWPRRASVESRTKWRYWPSNTNRAKLYVRDLLAVPISQPGAFHLPEDMPEFIRDRFCLHLCAEEWDASKGRWVELSGENHLLDAMAMQVCGCLAMRVRLSSIEDEPEAPVAQGYEPAQERPAKVGSVSAGWKVGR